MDKTQDEPTDDVGSIRSVQCAECDRWFPTSRGLRMHFTRSHQKADPDETFELIGNATEALFPDGIPTSRIIEIADLQKAMLKVLTR